ncbi:ABC transporter ATP-binding protein [Collinsella vaginalis]|uniref:ABC transporter ATP-binding protein n=1 Tax=Collinsella vaginalis TaxID=1870987 RepID=UPI000A26B637|nr:ATP-binding cassette domain-containing protein [Collinsella vaginalis]
MTLEAQGIGFGYPGARPLFEDASLTVGAGERVALSAPSGAGKTTLCRLLAGYLRPQRGRVLVDGASLPRTGPRPVQLLWQHPEQAFDPRMRLASSLAEAGEVDGEPARELRERFGVRDAWLSRLPHELSGGELMRSSMVRALMTEPRYLIADEATAMLDALTQAELWAVLLDLAAQEGMGIVLVSHSPALVRRVATRVVDLADLR